MTRNNTPVAPATLVALDRLLEKSSPTELLWLSGYLAGLARGAAPQPVPASGSRVTVVYGTQTNNCRGIAERLGALFLDAGVDARVVRASDYATRTLKDEQRLIIVISTQGEGDPPEDSLGFCEFILGKRAPQLPNLSYSVLSLGDSSYAKFCHVGRVLDERLASLGAARIVDRVDCDVEFAAIANEWSGAVVAKLRSGGTPTSIVAATVSDTRSQRKEHPALATVLLNQRLTGRNALKDVRHFELAFDGHYQPGDALGVWPENSKALVDELLAATGLANHADEEINRDGKTASLVHWLTHDLELTKLARPFLLAHAERVGGEFTTRVANAEAAAALLGTHQVIDIARQHPVTWSASELVHALRRLTPRSYSIASSPRRSPGEVHLTVALVDYVAFGTRHHGCATDYLARLSSERDDQLRVFIEDNSRFRLPADGDANIIMIGPGTGVAPFRAFVQERAELGVRGKNWLFFGEQHFTSQFLYQTEWQAALKDGSLQRIDLAFSRDQAAKVYVQDRLRERGADVWSWLAGGAYLYVCGDAKHMAPDVERALLDIARSHGALDQDNAHEWLANLRDDGRYRRDVY